MPPSPQADPPIQTASRRRRYLSLFQRVAGINVLLLLLAVAVTIVILVPGHEASYKINEEGVVLLVAVALMVLLNLFLLRRVMLPLQRLTAVARKVDLKDPKAAAPRREGQLGGGRACADVQPDAGPASGMEVSCRIAPELPPLPGDVELVIYRVAQEALTNVARHSGSSRAELSLAPDGGGLVLTVRDEGRGLAPDGVVGAGIRGMRERASLVDATLEISNGDHRAGAEVRLHIPAPVSPIPA